MGNRSRLVCPLPWQAGARAYIPISSSGSGGAQKITRPPGTTALLQWHSSHQDADAHGRQVRRYQGISGASEERGDRKESGNAGRAFRQRRRRKAALRRKRSRHTRPGQRGVSARDGVERLATRRAAVGADNRRPSGWIWREEDTGHRRKTGTQESVPGVWRREQARFLR